MRDNHDAKAMARTLREDLTAKGVSISISESLEIVSHMFGVADWNTLAALTRESQTAHSSSHETVRLKSLPAIPVRDFVPLPAPRLPLFVKRDKTLRALEEAFKVQRQIVLVAQKSPVTDDPSGDDVYSVGTIARVLDIGKPSQEVLSARPEAVGCVEVLVQPHRRVNILKFGGIEGAYSADVGEIDEGPIPSDPELIQTAATCFEKYAAAQKIALPPQWSEYHRYRDPGRFADGLALLAPIRLTEKQELLETFNPVERLEKLVSLMADS